MVTLLQGVHRIDAATYHADKLRPEPTLSSGVARVLIGRSPLHAWTGHPRLNPAYEATESATFDIGRAAHRAVLGVGDDYVAYPEELLAANGAASTKAAKEWAEEQRAAGCIPMKADDVDRIGAIADAALSRLAEMGIAFAPARSELTALAEIDGVWCRAMIDNAPLDPALPLYDVKTCRNANPDAVLRDVAEYGYDVQAAWYLDAWKAATGEDRRFRFVFVEKEAPYEVSVVELLNRQDDSADFMQDAREKCGEARRLWRECLTANTWPGYRRGVALLGAPSWHRQKWADRPTPAPIVPQATKDRAHAWQAPERMTQ